MHTASRKWLLSDHHAVALHAVGNRVLADIMKLRTRSPWLMQEGPNPVTNVLTRDTQKETWREGRPRGDAGRDWRDAATSQEPRGAPGDRRSSQEPLLEPAEGTAPPTPGGLTSRVQNRQRLNSAVLSLQYLLRQLEEMDAHSKGKVLPRRLGALSDQRLP